MLLSSWEENSYIYMTLGIQQIEQHPNQEGLC